MGPGPTDDQLNDHYLRMRDSDVSKGIGSTMESKYMFDSFWPQTYRGLKDIMEDPDTRPHMIVADFFVDAVKDMHVQYNVALAIVFPQMPMLMYPCPYVPGQPGFQLEGTLTSETASIGLRLANEWVIIKSLPTILRFFRWTKKLRAREGVHYKLPSSPRPDYLVLINSFWGLEVPRDLPPLATAIGPILADEYPPLDEPCAKFLSKHEKVLYIALGTHVILSNSDASKIVSAVLRLLEDNLLHGVIWAIGKTGRQDLNLDERFDIGDRKVRLGDMLDGKHSKWLFCFFAPQRAVLEHESTKLYYTHGGGSSANEGLYHGKPMLAMGIFFDQIANTTRLAAAGVAEPLSKFSFTADTIHGAAKRILEDSEGSYRRNVLRMKHLARVCSRRKHHAADLIEEVMYDTELRYGAGGEELRHMHLQTADMRMPKYKAKNWDLMAVGLVAAMTIAGSTYFLGRALWSGTSYILNK